MAVAVKGENVVSVEDSEFDAAFGLVDSVGLSPEDEDGNKEDYNPLANKEEKGDAATEELIKGKSEVSPEEDAPNESTIFTGEAESVEDLEDDAEAKDEESLKDWRSPISSLIEKGVIMPFEGEEDKINDYTPEEFAELIEANIEGAKERAKEEVKEAAEAEMINELPPVFNIAYNYYKEGGKDTQSLLRALSQAVDVTSLDPDNGDDHEKIVRLYFKETQSHLMSPEEIESEILSLKTKGELGRKAESLHPKLIAIEESKIQKRLDAEAHEREIRRKEYQEYENSVAQALSKGEIGGVKIDRKTQELLYSGLLARNYTTRAGHQTSLFGHLLEKYQFIEPNPEKLLKALWVLADEDGFTDKMKSAGREEQHIETKKTLKGLQDGKKIATATSENKDVKKAAERVIVSSKPSGIKRTILSR